MGELEDAISALERMEQDSGAHAADAELRTQQLMQEFVTLMRRNKVRTSSYFEEVSSGSRWGKHTHTYRYLGQCWVYGEYEGTYDAVSTEGEWVHLWPLIQQPGTGYRFDSHAPPKGLHTGAFYTGSFGSPPTAEQLATGARRLIKGKSI